MITDAEIRANRKTWTDALRSGEYRNGRGTLRDDDDSYSSFDVLCETGVTDGEWIKRGPHFEWDCASMVSYQYGLSPLQRAAVGLDIASETRLVEMANGRTKNRPTFDEIADYIDSLPIEKGTR